MNISVLNFHTVEGHPYLRALADLEVNKITLRGLRLEDRGRGEFTLGFPGRKIQGHWQVLYQTHDPQTHSLLLQSLVGRYEEGRERRAA